MYIHTDILHIYIYIYIYIYMYSYIYIHIYLYIDKYDFVGGGTEEQRTKSWTTPCAPFTSPSSTAMFFRHIT